MQGIVLTARTEALGHAPCVEAQLHQPFSFFRVLLTLTRHGTPEYKWICSRRKEQPNDCSL